MKDVKKTKVPLPGLKKKPKAQQTLQKAQLSHEFIGSDDDSSAETTPKHKQKPKTSIGVHGGDGAVKSTSKQKLNSKAKATPKKAAPTRIATQAQAAELSTSEQTDDDDNHDAPTRDVQTSLPGNKTRASTSSSDSSSEDLDSDPDSDPDVLEASQSARKPAQEQARASQSQPHTVEFRPTQSYVPPKGFNAVPCNDKTTSKSAHIFDNLEGKQIWHITAPAGVSISELRNFAMDCTVTGESVLLHKGTRYGLSRIAETSDGACEVMIPQMNGYKAVSTPIAQSLRLRADVQLPQLSSKQADQNTGSEAAASITRSTIRAPRPQLKGLKMRFRPTGFGSGDAGTLGNSDSEDNVPKTTAGLGMPDGLNLPSRKEKRKHTALNGDVKADSPSKKHKKDRTAEDVQRKEERRAKKEKKRAKDAITAKA